MVPDFRRAWDFSRVLSDVGRKVLVVVDFVDDVTQARMLRFARVV